MRRNRLLLDEKPLIILPELATKIGLNEAIVLQQINYWLVDSNHIYEGRRWVYNTYAEWQKQLPFWSINTIRRAIAKLETTNLVISGNFNKMKLDNTKWYTINFEELEKLEVQPITQDGQSTCPKWADGETNLGRPIPETTTKTTSNNKPIGDNDKKSSHKQIMDYYHNKFLSIFNVKPVINGGKDGSAIKKLLTTFTAEELIILLDKFFASNDTFIKNSGYTLSIFSTQINKLNISVNSAQPINAQQSPTPLRHDSKTVDTESDDFKAFLKLRQQQEKEEAEKRAELG